MTAHFIGTDGRVYPADETTLLINLCSDPQAFGPEKQDAWARTITQRASLTGGCSVFFLQAITPSLLSVFPEFFPVPINYPQNCPARLLVETAKMAGIGKRTVDLSAPLRDDPQKDRLYEIDGARWTAAVGRKSGNLLLLSLSAIGALDGLDGRTTDAIAETLSIRDVNPSGMAFLAQANLGPAHPEIGARIAYGTRPATFDDGTLVIFDDGLLFEQHEAVARALAWHLHEIHLVCSQDIDYSYAARVGANIVIAGVAIQKLDNLPTDQWHIEVAEWHINERFRLMSDAN